MVARPQELVDKLQSADSHVKLKALREVKNQVIGNRNKKIAYLQLGALEHIIDVLSEAVDMDINLLVQSAATIGSLTYRTEDGVKVVVQRDGISHLLRALDSDDDRVIESTVRALKLIYLSELPPRGPILAPKALQRLVDLLSHHLPSVAEMAAAVLSHCCETEQQRSAVVATGAISAVCRLLSSTRDASRDASVALLAGLTKGCPEACRQVLAHPGILDRLRSGTVDSGATRSFHACATIVHLSRGPTADSATSQRLDRLCVTVLPLLVRLLANPSLNQEVPEVLAELMRGRPALLQAARDADALRQLSALLSQLQGPARCGCLSALAALVLDREDCRQQLAESRGMLHVQDALLEADGETRAAAALVMRGMTRSLRTLRSRVVEPQVTERLCGLLYDSLSKVQASAAEALCNLVLEFSSTKEVVLRAGGVTGLAGLARSMLPTLRLDAMWALKNLAWQASTTVKRSIAQELGWSDLCALLRDEDPRVAVEAAALLRNLPDGVPADADVLLEWAQPAGLWATLEELIDPTQAAAPEVVEHLLYALSNVAAAGGEARRAVWRSNLPPLLLHHLRAAHSGCRLAAVWAVLNLTEAEERAERRAAVARLGELGLLQQLGAMRGDTCCDVRHKVRVALEQCSAAT